MKYLCLAYEEEHKLDALSRDEWDSLRKETLDYVEDLRLKEYIDPKTLPFDGKRMFWGGFKTIVSL